MDAKIEDIDAKVAAVERQADGISSWEFRRADGGPLDVLPVFSSMLSESFPAL